MNRARPIHQVATDATPLPSDLVDILNAAVPLWAKLTNTKLGTDSFSFRIGSDSAFQDYDLKRYIEDLNDARQKDLTGTTAILMLRGLFAAYLKEKTVDLHTLLYSRASIESQIARYSAFHDLIDRPVCVEAERTFIESLRSAAVHYGYDLAKLKKMIGSSRDLASIRLAAYRSVDELATHQFAQGPRDPAPLQYNREIFEFTNVNSFIYAMRRQMVSGITIALIRGRDSEDDVYRAYFVIGIRNGETITILTDFAEGEHPEYHRMTRRPERRLDDRANKHWFPYHLLDDEAAKRRKVVDKTALVPIDAKPRAISKISDLDPGGFVWTILLFDLLRDKFERDDFKTPELSYTGEMVVSPHALVEADSALVLAGQYQPLVLPRLTVETTTPEAADNEPPLGFNTWIEERYRHRVPEIMLDVVGDRMALEVGKQAAKLLPGDADPSNELAREDLPSYRQERGVIRWGSDHRIRPIAPQALDPTTFGTRQQLERNRGWYARQNLMRAIQRLATADFIAKSKQIVWWYRTRVERNMEMIWNAVATGKLEAPIGRWGSSGEDGFPDRDEITWTTGNIIKQSIRPNGRHWQHGIVFGNHSDSRPGSSYGHYGNECAINPPERATMFTVIDPENWRALAMLAGVREERLPWPLRNWMTQEPYTGNSILRRIDPLDAWLDNPWRHLDLRITIALSKRSYNALCKRIGVTPRTIAELTKDSD